jgi:capsular exopolysaccharide synthesis family protein
MDKLEKALSKAREMRRALAEAALVPSPEAAGEAAGEGDAAAADDVQVSPPRSRAIAVEMAELERNRIVARLTRDSTADAFRILRTKILQQMTRLGANTLAVTSPNYGDGKSTIATNLAMSLALDVKKTVLLVDLDLRNPSIHHFLGMSPDIGLTDYFVDDVPVPDCLVRPEIERLMVLPIVTPLDNSSEILGTPKMAALAQELKTRYSDRLVIYDMPPILAQDDTIAFLPHVDAVLLVVRDGVTCADDVRKCMYSLGDVNLIGTVLNNSSEYQYNK